MVNFNFRLKSHRKNYLWYNIIFQCDAGSLFSFLSEQAMSKLSGGEYIPQHMIADIGDISLGFELSQPTLHFAGVNDLGMGFLLQTDASVLIHKAQNSVELRVYIDWKMQRTKLYFCRADRAQDFGNMVTLVSAVLLCRDCSCVGQGRKSKFRKPFRSRRETL